ncbi:MAG: c-type cytochrome [Verrucomicrobiota bacterium]
MPPLSRNLFRGVFLRLIVIPLIVAQIGLHCSSGVADAAENLGPFFERDFPFFQTAVDLSPESLSKVSKRQIVVRGILLPQADGSTVLFDQELLRLAAWWQPPEGQPPVTLLSMAQNSYSEPHRKTGQECPKATAVPLQTTAFAPGIGASLAQLAQDPRPEQAGFECGRGPLSNKDWHFDGIEMLSGKTVLQYRYDQIIVREWYSSSGAGLQRTVEIAPHSEPVVLALAQSTSANWSIGSDSHAESASLSIHAGNTESSFLIDSQNLAAVLPPSATLQTYTFIYSSSSRTIPPTTLTNTSSQQGARRWPKTITTKIQANSVQSNGLALDKIPLPLENPWARRVRPCDVAFLSANRAAIVTFDGDVWLVEGFENQTLEEVKWQRFASGLNEPMSIAAVHGTLQVYTRNGIVRLHDRSGNGEADWYENFSDQWIQSSSTRAFPLDMVMTKDGSAYVTQGGLFTANKPGSIFAGAITRILPDGRSSEVFATRTREAYVTVHPKTGLVTATDQQGNFIPSSVCYVVSKGDSFGFGEEKPQKLTPPLTWIPHTEDNSCASQVWLDGEGMGPLSGQLMHLSYGRGVPFLISPDLDAPIPQGAVIPMPLPTEIPLLHGRMHPSGNSVYVTGFQIYDSRTATNWGLGRIRITGEPLPFPIKARSCKDGVLLTFANPLDPRSVKPEGIYASEWNYKRSKEYGSPRFNKKGKPGSDPLAVGQVLLSQDGCTVFVHLPGLEPVMQLAIEHEFKLKNGTPAKGSVYFTIHQPHVIALEANGFPGVDLNLSVPVVREKKRIPPSVSEGKELSQKMGCIACHSTDGSSEGKTGPTWFGLFGKDRIFTDGSNETANEFYIRTSILEPEKRIVKGFQPGMASYKGILNDDQIDSLILYIRTLK